MVMGSFEYGPKLRGVTGTEFAVIPNSEVQDRISDDEFEEYAKDWWRESVSADCTTNSLSEFMKYHWPDDESRIETLFDSSYEWVHDDIREFYDIPENDVIDCISGGRIFPRAIEGMEWLPGMREKYLPIIEEFETN
jgi:hypothetical protein